MIDRAELERRRFARLVGIDGAVGSGLPIGERAEQIERRGRTDRDRTDDSR